MPAPAKIDFSSFGPHSEMTYGYCTELLLQLQSSKVDLDSFDLDSLKGFLMAVGDSVVAFRTENIVKLHVHTFTPERVLGYCRRYGEFLTVKIENMSVQHTELEEKEKAEAEPSKQVADTPKKQYGTVAVGSSEKLDALFHELGADEVILGGQTKNPSTSDFLEAFAKINAECIFVFPNNSNIFMAAQQAGELYKEAEIRVVPSKSIGTGYVALSCADLSNSDPEVVFNGMTEAIDRVTAGYISPSIRDADMNGVHINNGDTIGIIGKDIVVSKAERMEAVKVLASMLLELPEKFMLTVFCGEDSSESEQNELTAYISENYPDAELYYIDGGQEIYPYIFVAE